MASSRSIARSRQGARKILSDCLRLQTGDTVTVFFDETTLKPAHIILEEARRLGLLIRERWVPVAEQLRFSSAPTQGLSIEDVEAISGARGILTCLSDNTGSTSYRCELVRLGTDPGRRLGHMPGITTSLLASAINIDYELASSRCDDLCLAMSLGRRAHLRTYLLAPRGRVSRELDLRCELGGLQRPSITSTGIIPLGTWGNLPGGETFIAPLEGTANGEFALNGSFREAVLKTSESLVLGFEKGQLTTVEGPPDRLKQFNRFLAYGQERHDDSFDALAELGIGVNPGLRRLTGNALLDEKCAGTAHIALGDNTRYGGLLYSRIHEDLVTRRPSLWIDEKPILEEGRFAFVPEQWRESLATTVPDPELTDFSSLIKRTTVDAEIAPDGTLRVRREVAAGRLCTYTVADRMTSSTLASIYAAVPSLPLQIRTVELIQQAHGTLGLTPQKVSGALTILHRHGLVALKRSYLPQLGDPS